MSAASRLLLIVYNVVWWVPVVLPLFGVMSYRAGTIVFFTVTLTRVAINLYRNNVMSVDAAQRFPLRQP